MKRPARGKKFPESTLSPGLRPLPPQIDYDTKPNARRRVRRTQPARGEAGVDTRRWSGEERDRAGRIRASIAETGLLQVGLGLDRETVPEFEVDVRDLPGLYIKSPGWLELIDRITQTRPELANYDTGEVAVVVDLVNATRRPLFGEAVEQSIPASQVDQAVYASIVDGLTMEIQGTSDTGLQALYARQIAIADTLIGGVNGAVSPDAQFPFGF